MRKETVTIELVDDLDGSKADRTVQFTVDGKSFELDLSKKNARNFDKSLEPWIAHARSVKPLSARRRTPVAKSAKRDDLAEIRVWAQANGHAVSDRGRVAASVVEQYDAAH